jgi:Tol biopolymer transport system component
LGGAARKLAVIPYNYYPSTGLSWSPDAKLIAFSEPAPQASWSISILDMATQQKRRLGHPDPSCHESWIPAFSPDGSFLAFVCMVSEGVNDVFVEPVSGGAARRVAHVNGEILGIAWSGDGKSLVFAVFGNLMRVSVAGGEPQRLLSGRDVETPAISRDGRRLAYAQHVVNTNIWRVPLTGSPPAALRPTRLISSTREEWLPAFSPDGRRLAFTSNRSGSGEVWISDADGSNPRPVTSFGGPLTGSPRWSPDGRWVVLDSRARGRSDVYVVASEGGVPRRVETGQPDSETPFWSSDGEWLYFASPVNGMPQVFKVRQEGGRATRLTVGGGSWPQSAPDGKRIYYWSEGKETSIWSVSSSGGDERPVEGMPPIAWESSVSWALGPSGIHFLEGGSHPGVVFFDFATARARRVADLPGAPEPWAGIALSPDGRSVLFSKVEQGTSDIMLIEDFR